MAFFFPNLAVPTYMKKKENIQRTLALIRPEAFASSKGKLAVTSLCVTYTVRATKCDNFLFFSVFLKAHIDLNSVDESKLTFY